MSRRDSRENADRLIAATRRLWQHEASPSLEAVAQEAGLAIATLYRHFPNRVALEKAAFSRIFVDEVGPLVAHPPANDRDLLDVADEFVAVVARYAPLFDKVGVSEVADEALAHLGEFFIDLLRRGQETDVLRTDIEPVDLLWLLRMAVLGLAHEAASSTVRRRYLALLLSALSPDNTAALPPLSSEDYERLGVPPEHHGSTPSD